MGRQFLIPIPELASTRVVGDRDLFIAVPASSRLSPNKSHRENEIDRSEER
jgi:hypothetical protein